MACARGEHSPAAVVRSPSKHCPLPMRACDGSDADIFRLPGRRQDPSKYTCEGDDISPPLAFGGVPEGAKSLALIIDDPDAPDPKAPKRVWVHWLVYNLPPDTKACPRMRAGRACPRAP